jgi:6,7-dimethyl-8-ribityllumazine synthase
MQHATRGTFKKFNAKEYRIAIVVAQFNRDITEAIAENAASDPTRFDMIPPGGIMDT